MNPIVIVGHVSGVSGYGQHSIECARWLERLTGIPTVIRAISVGPMVSDDIKGKFVEGPQESEWELLIHPPKPIFLPTPGKKTVCFSMWESTKLPADAVANLNKCEAVIVPNDWNATVFSASGVTVPIHICPLGINPDLFRWRPLPDPKVCVFGTAGSGQRKGLDDVVRCFLEAFPDNENVRLRVKLRPCDQKTFGGVVDSRIDVICKDLTDVEMAEWYGSLHCFVTASKGEGWGIMPHQALSMGRAVIFARVAGIPDFFPDCGVDYSLEPAEGIYAGSKWFQPNVSEIRKDMLAAAEMAGRGSFSELSLEHFSSLAISYSWGWSGKKLHEALKDVGMITDSGWEEMATYVPSRPAGDAYYHSGNLGDIIYALAAIKAHGGGKLILGPSQVGTVPCAPAINPETFKMLRPLLEIQDYLESVEYREHYPTAEIGHDLNKFRERFQNPRTRHQEAVFNLCQAHFLELGIKNLWDEQDEWLTAFELRADQLKPNGRIIIHRSARYQASDSMWRSLVCEHGRNLLFVGLPDEHQEFEKKFGRVAFWKVRDFLEMAQLIASARGFVGNQSFPMALAIGLGQNIVQETCGWAPDCIYHRSNFHSQHNNVRKIVKGWL